MNLLMRVSILSSFLAGCVGPMGSLDEDRSVTARGGQTYEEAIGPYPEKVSPFRPRATEPAR